MGNEDWALIISLIAIGFSLRSNVIARRALAIEEERRKDEVIDREEWTRLAQEQSTHEEEMKRDFSRHRQDGEHFILALVDKREGILASELQSHYRSLFGSALHDILDKLEGLEYISLDCSGAPDVFVNISPIGCEALAVWNKHPDYEAWLRGVVANM